MWRKQSLLCNLMLILCVCMPPTGSRVRVILNKSSSDLGFSLEGGVGSSSGDKPLTVQKIFRGKTTFSWFLKQSHSTQLYKKSVKINIFIWSHQLQKQGQTAAYLTPSCYWHPSCTFQQSLIPSSSITIKSTTCFQVVQSMKCFLEMSCWRCRVRVWWVWCVLRLGTSSRNCPLVQWRSYYTILSSHVEDLYFTSCTTILKAIHSSFKHSFFSIRIFAVTGSMKLYSSKCSVLQLGSIIQHSVLKCLFFSSLILDNYELILSKLRA